MTLLNDMRDALGAALKVDGHSINSRDPAEIKQASERLIAWKQNIAKFESEQYKSGIASGEFLLVQGHSIDIAQVRQDDEEVVFGYPEEGAILAIDYMAMPRGGRSPDLAYAFINFMLEPEHAAQNMAHIKGLVPVKPAYELLRGLRTDPMLFHLRKTSPRWSLSRMLKRISPITTRPGTTLSVGKNPAATPKNRCKLDWTNWTNWTGWIFTNCPRPISPNRPVRPVQFATVFQAQAIRARISPVNGYTETVRAIWETSSATSVISQRRLHPQAYLQC